MLWVVVWIWGRLVNPRWFVGPHRVYIKSDLGCQGGGSQQLKESYCNLMLACIALQTSEVCSNTCEWRSLCSQPQSVLLMLCHIYLMLGSPHDAVPHLSRVDSMGRFCVCVGLSIHLVPASSEQANPTHLAVFLSCNAKPCFPGRLGIYRGTCFFPFAARTSR